MIITGTTENFQEEVLNYQGKVLVDFWATWCGPCQMLSPIIDEIANEYQGQVKVVKINVDEQGELSDKYQVTGIPTVILFNQGEIVQTFVGFKQKNDFVSAL